VTSAMVLMFGIPFLPGGAGSVPSWTDA